MFVEIFGIFVAYVLIFDGENGERTGALCLGNFSAGFVEGEHGCSLNRTDSRGNRAFYEGLACGASRANVYVENGWRTGATDNDNQLMHSS